LYARKNACKGTTKNGGIRMNSEEFE